MGENVRVYLIDRAGAAANAFAAKLEDRTGVDLVSGAAELDEALEGISDTHPEVILVGTDVGGAGVADAIERVLTVAGDAAVVALCTREDKTLVDAAVRAGAAGSLDRTATAADTITALHAYRDRQHGEQVDLKLAEPPGQVAGLRVSGALPRFPTPMLEPSDRYSSPSIEATATPVGVAAEAAAGEEPGTPAGTPGAQQATSGPAEVEPASAGDDLSEMRDMLRREAAQASRQAPKKKGWRLFGRRRQKTSRFGPRQENQGEAESDE